MPGILLPLYTGIQDNIWLKHNDIQGPSYSHCRLVYLHSRCIPTDLLGASGSASDRRQAIAEFAHHYPTDPIDVIIADFMSEFNMATAAGRRVDQATSQEPTAPAYELSFLEALEPALDDLAKYGIKLAVNAGVTDTKGLYEVVMRMVEAKKLDLKVSQRLAKN